MATVTEAIPRNRRRKEQRMVDLHVHILPGLDDGAQTMEDALEMARIAADSGTRICAATSHGKFSRRNQEEYLIRYRRKLAEFCAELKKQEIPLDIRSGMELLADEALLRFADAGALPGYGGGNCILTEFCFDISERRALETLEILQKKGYRIVLAHPERYDFIKRRPEVTHMLYRMNVILQVNAGSIEGKFGRGAFRAADRMLGEGIAGLVASDAHDPFLRTPDMEETSRILDLYYGSDASRILLVENPRRILEGRQIR